MKIRIQIISIMPLLIIFGKMFGQDTARYSQENASLFSNVYTFVKDKKTDVAGIFYQEGFTDDGQTWYGKGTFRETKNKFYLDFDTTGCHNRIIAAGATKKPDTLYIKWCNWCGQQQIVYNIRYTDATNKTIYDADWQTGIVKIPLADLKDRKLSLYPFGGNRKLTDFVIPAGTEKITIFANDTEMHTYGGKTEILKRKGNGFVTVGMWTNGKRTKFVKRN
ncbi:MAG: hypothetical protein JWP12_2221 [Bacteroidetes bacterium]|nr:hypothetical protein [Bacteroidota bacterium]